MQHWERFKSYCGTIQVSRFAEGVICFTHKVWYTSHLGFTKTILDVDLQKTNVPSDSTDLSLSFTGRELNILLDLSRKLNTSETWPVTGPHEVISLTHLPSGTHSECSVICGFFTGQNETGLRWNNRPRDIRIWTCTWHSFGQSVQRQVARKTSKVTHRPRTRIDQFPSSLSGSRSSPL